MAMEPQHAYQHYQPINQKLGTFVENREGALKIKATKKITRIKVLRLD